VVFETALSLILLVSAGLLLKSFIRLRTVDKGFNTTHLITFSIDVHSLAGHSEGATDMRPAYFYAALADRLKQLPGVYAVGSVTTLPMTGSMASMTFHIQGQPLSGQEPNAGYDAVSSEYFKTMAIPLLRGRYFTDQDQDQKPPVIIINQEMAAEYFVGSDPIGKHIIAGKGGKAHEIVGIVGNVKHESLYLPDRPAMYVPAAQDPWLFSSFVVRTEQDPDSISRDIRQTLWSMNKTIPVFRLMTMKQIVSGSIGQRELNSLLLGAFAGVALLLCAIGLYGMMAYSVSLRAHEIGIRMAVGARVENVRHMILKEGLYLALSGVTVGILGSLLSTRFLKTMLFGVNQIDLSTLATVSGVLLCVAAVASYIPARRATKIDPIIALRHE
jgi:putative ABC transport system permease protein